MITYKYVKNYLYDTCQYVLQRSLRAENPVFKPCHIFARNCKYMYVEARIYLQIRAIRAKIWPRLDRGFWPVVNVLARICTYQVRTNVSIQPVTARVWQT